MSDTKIKLVMETKITLNESECRALDALNLSHTQRINHRYFTSDGEVNFYGFTMMEVENA